MSRHSATSDCLPPPADPAPQRALGRRGEVLGRVLGVAGLGLLAAACQLQLTGWHDGAALPSAGIVPSSQPVSQSPSQSPSQSLSQSATQSPSMPYAQVVRIPPAPVAAGIRSASASPTRLRLPSSGIDAPVVAVTAEPGGDLEVPPDPHTLGWWRDGAHPAGSEGTVVIVGHVDTARDGAGALFRLAQVRVGQQIVLDTDMGPHEYVIAGLRTYPKAELPADVFTTTGRPRLVLITCGGEFDRHTGQYADNVVAYAVPQDPAPSDGTASPVAAGATPDPDRIHPAG